MSSSLYGQLTALGFARKPYVNTQITNAVESTQTAANLAVAAWTSSMAPAETLPAISQSAHYGTIVAQTIYDTSKDSDGGAWIKKCQDKSWYKETLGGTAWLATKCGSEAIARAVIQSAAKPNLVSNGDFADGTTTGWTAGAGTIAAVSSELEHTRVGANGWVYQAITTVSGRTYSVALTSRKGTSNTAYARASSGINGTGTVLGQDYTSSATNVPLSFTFTASATTTYLNVGGADTNGTTYFDNITVREVDTTVSAAGYVYQSTADGKFYSLTGSSGQTEVFRGISAEFPAVAWCVAEAGRVVVYDLAAPGVPMWRSIVAAVSDRPLYTGAITSIAAGQGVVIVGQNSSNGAVRFDFASDEMFNHYTGTTYNAIIQGGIAASNSLAVYRPSQKYASIVNSTVNSVAITYLPTSPVDPATGLKVPTIAVATAGGVSVIKDDGTVVNSALTFAAGNVSFDSQNRVRWVYLSHLACSPKPPLSASFTAESAGNVLVLGSSGGAFTSMEIPSGVRGSSPTASAKNAIGTLYGITVHKTDGTAAQSMVAGITQQYNTGYMPGDIRLATLCDTTAETVTGSEPDRSVKNKGGVINGSLVKTSLGTAGSSLVAYSGFSAANYFEFPYDSGLDFSTNDFSACLWVKTGADIGTAQFLFDRADTAVSPRLQCFISGGTVVLSTINSSGVASSITSAASSIAANSTYFLCVGRDASGLYLYINAASSVGSSVTPTTARSITSVDGSAKLCIGVKYDHSTPCLGSLFNVRISGTAMSADQVAQAYRDELPLALGANCVIAGTSPAVTALAYSDKTDVLSVGTSQYRSDFKGLQRVAAVAGAVTSLAAGGEAIATNGTMYQPAISLRDELARKSEQLAYYGAPPVFFDYTATASQTAFVVPKGYTALALYKNGTLMRETTTGVYWTRSNDGYQETCTLSVGATMSDWISIMAVKA